MNWQINKLGDLCQIKTGKSNAEDANPSGEYAFFDRSKNIKKSSRFLFDCEALIIPGEGSEFFPRYFSGKFDLHQRAYALYNFKKNVDIRYVEYYLIFNHKYFSNVAVGATAKSLRLRHFQDMEIPIPPLLEQQRIVKILDSVFKKLEIVNQYTLKNFQNSNEIFSSYLQNIFDNNNNWPQKNLKEVSLDFGRGKSKHRPRNDKKLYGGKYPFIQTGNIRNSDHFITKYSQTYNEYGLAQSKLWPRGTLCITIAANIAETGILNFDACFPDSVIGLVANPKLAINEYIEFLLQSFKVMLQGKSKGSAQSNINMATFENELFPFPNIEKQKEIITNLELLRNKTNEIHSIYNTQSLLLEELKKSILTQAFSGNL